MRVPHGRARALRNFETCANGLSAMGNQHEAAPLRGSKSRKLNADRPIEERHQQLRLWNELPLQRVLFVAPPMGLWQEAFDFFERGGYAPAVRGGSDPCWSRAATKRS